MIIFIFLNIGSNRRESGQSSLVDLFLIIVATTGGTISR